MTPSDLKCEEKIATDDHRSGTSVAVDRLYELKGYFAEQRKREDSFTKPNPTYFKKFQSVMIPEWRERMAAWMFGVTRSFGICPDSVDTALYIFDRYFSVYQARDKVEVQQVSLVGLWIASLFYDYHPIGLHEVESLSSGYSAQPEFSRPVFVSLQKKLLKLLDYRVAYPSAFLFARDLLLVVKLVAEAGSHHLDAATVTDVQRFVKLTLEQAVAREESIAFSNLSLGISAVSFVWKAFNLDEDTFKRALSELELSSDDYEDCRKWMSGDESGRPPSPVSVDDIAGCQHAVDPSRARELFRPIEEDTTRSASQKRKRTRSDDEETLGKRKCD